MLNAVLEFFHPNMFYCLQKFVNTIWKNMAFIAVVRYYLRLTKQADIQTHLSVLPWQFRGVFLCLLFQYASENLSLLYIVRWPHQNQNRDCLFHFVVETDKNDITLLFLLDILQESTIWCKKYTLCMRYTIIGIWSAVHPKKDCTVCAK